MALQGAAPRVFISSAMGGGLANLRQEIAARLRAEGAEPFRFEEFQSEVDWLRASPAENENICLGKIEWSDSVLGLIGTSYGGSGRQHLAGVALTDLELFHALRLGKRMRVYVLMRRTAPSRWSPCSRSCALCFGKMSCLCRAAALLQIRSRPIFFERSTIAGRHCPVRQGVGSLAALRPPCNAV